VKKKLKGNCIEIREGDSVEEGRGRNGTWESRRVKNILAINIM
jgi:hypothetical protein